MMALAVPKASAATAAAPPKPIANRPQVKQHEPVASTSRLPALPTPATALKSNAKGKGKATVGRRESSRAPARLSSAELDEARAAATSRLASAWADIAHRHETVLPSSSSSAGWVFGSSRWLPEEEDDIIDLDTMEIVQDRGVLRGTKFGALQFGGKGALSLYDNSDEEGAPRPDTGEDEDCSEDELAAFDPLESLPSLSFRERRRTKEAERLHLLEFTMQETKARQMRASVAAGGTLDGVDDEEWERTRRKLERGSGNEVLDVPAGATGRVEDGVTDDEDEFSAFKVTPTTARKLPPSSKEALAVKALTLSSTSAKAQSKATAPSSTTRTISKGLQEITLAASSSPAPKRTQTTAPKMSSPRVATGRATSTSHHALVQDPISTVTSYGLRSSSSTSQLADAAMPPPPLPLPRPRRPLPTSRSLPTFLSHQASSSSSPLAVSASAALSPKRAPSVNPRSRRESTFFLDLEVPTRHRSVTPAIRSVSSVVPPSSSTKPKPTSTFLLRLTAAKTSSPLKQRLPPSPSPDDLSLDMDPPRSLRSRLSKEIIALKKRPRVSDPVVLELSDSDEDDGPTEGSAVGDFIKPAARRIGLATPPDSKGSTSARRSTSASAPSSASPTKKQRRSLSPLKHSLQPSSYRPISPQSSGIFDLTKSTAALVVASSRSPSAAAQPSSSPRRRSSGSLARPSTASPRPLHSGQRDVFFNPTPASEQDEDEDELLLTASSARASPLKPEGVEQSLEGIRLGAQGMGFGWVSPEKGWEVLDLTAESDDELDLLSG